MPWKPWIDELDRINELFNNRYIARTSDYATESHETAIGKRSEITATHTLLCNVLNSHSIFNNSPGYSKTISEINSLSEQYSLMLKQRRAHSKKTKKGTRDQSPQ